MRVTDPGQAQHSQLSQSRDFGHEISCLREAGAGRFDPVGLYYLHTLAERTDGQTNKVKGILEGKLSQALMVFRERFFQAQRQTQGDIAHTAPHPASTAAELQRLLEAGDFKAVRQTLEAMKPGQPPSPLSELSRYLARQSAAQSHVHRDGPGGLHSELKATQFFRTTWSKLSVGKRVTHELDHAPKNAGPINSHMLVLRSLTKMRDISPDYLARFTSYVDTLLNLDQCDKDPKRKPEPTRPARAKAAKK